MADNQQLLSLLSLPSVLLDPAKQQQAVSQVDEVYRGAKIVTFCQEAAYLCPGCVPHGDCKCCFIFFTKALQVETSEVSYLSVQFTFMCLWFCLM